VRDAAAASAEYGAEFRTDVAGFLTDDLLERSTVQLPERPPLNAVQYFAFCDPSGGLSDSFALAIAHYEREKAALDFLREIPAPFSPEAAVASLAEDLRRYKITEVTGDHFAGEWPREQFAKRRIEYITSELSCSEIYLEFLPALSAGSVELLAHPRLRQQFLGLERRTSRVGRDLIDHSPGAHDDLCNATAGALVRVLVANTQQQVHPLFEMFSGTAEEIETRFARVRGELTLRWDQATAKAAATPKPEGACLECGSMLIVNIAGTVMCNQCQHVFSKPEVRVYYASRPEMLAASDSRGWTYGLGQKSWWQK
jgi:hypothetical protein